MRKRTTRPPAGGSPAFFMAVLAAALPAVLVGCAKSGTEKTNNRSISTNYVEGSFVVSASGDTDADGLKSASESVADELGCKVAAFDQINWGSVDSVGVLSEDMKNTFNVRFENCDFSKEGTNAILSKFESQTGISGIEVVALASAAPIKENDQYKQSQDHLGFIRRDQACNASERNNQKPVIVAVVDSGVDVDHPDLVDMFYKDRNGRIIGANFVGSGAYMAPDDNWDDKSGHGTHVAGLIGAMANNTKGVVGVGSCANIKIMPIRVLNDEGRGTSIEIERGVKWAADNGAHIINLSLGFTAISSQANPSHQRSLYADLAKRNVVVFAAAGNDGYVNGSMADGGGYRWSYPSSYQNVISVAATNNQGSLTSFTNRGAEVDIAAPGYQVLSTTNDGHYGRMSGTSMATPVAAGAYALALASAEQGLDQIDRVDAKVAEDLLAMSTLSSVRLRSSDVSVGGVLDAEKLVKTIMAKYPKIDDEPVQDEPVEEPETPATPGDSQLTPIQPSQPQPAPVVQPVTPAPQPFAFVGLADGQRLSRAVSLEMKNLPTGTAVVYFYWGDSFWSFTKAYVDSGETSVKDGDLWYLYGNRSLTAVAYNKLGRALKVAKVNLKGF